MRKKAIKHLKITVVVFLLAIILFPSDAIAVELPKPTNNFFVNDFASVIDSEYEQQIQNEAVSLYEKTGVQVVVATINSLDGESLEEYSNLLFREWGIGAGEKDNGVLMLISVGDRLSRIEVGYGLEGALPDGKTGRIQDNYMAPSFRDDDYGTGIISGFYAIINEIYTEYGIEYEASDYQYVGESTEEDSNRSLAIIFFAIIIIIDLIFFRGRLTRLLLIMASRSSRGHGSHRGGRGGGFSGGGGSSADGRSSRGW